MLQGFERSRDRWPLDREEDELFDYKSGVSSWGCVITARSTERERWYLHHNDTLVRIFFGELPDERKVGQ